MKKHKYISFYLPMNQAFGARPSGRFNVRPCKMLQGGSGVNAAHRFSGSRCAFVRGILSLAAIVILAVTSVASGRESKLLDSGWRFQLEAGDGAEQPGFDDSRWQPVSVPHCWGWKALQQGEKNFRSPGWYRRELDCARQPGRRYFLRFGAAGTVADVYLNGQLVGQHRGGFGAFCFEITTNLSASGTNLLAVRVSNAPEPDIAPLKGDFPVYGGLYRRVHLIETSEQNFALTDHASPGVAWLETSVDSDRAVLDITAQISNGIRKKQPLTFVTKILDANGNEVAATNQDIWLAADMTAPYWSRIVVAKPHLWNGRKDPYLYTAVVELRSEDRVVDSVEQQIGLRSYRVDPDKGFFLNGKPYDLHGVARHQDRQDEGWAISHADMEEDVEMIKEIGATAVRCAHYQHSSYFYGLCDKAGILVWAEIPQVERIHGTPQFEDTSRNQLLDLIRQNINHPSIFCWSLFNEIIPGSDDPHRELQDLNILAHGEDPTRPTIAATTRVERKSKVPQTKPAPPRVEAMPQLNKITDLLGWNRYYGWYYGSLNDWGKELDERRYDSRHGGICLSEYGAGANPWQHEANVTHPTPGGQWHPEEWQADVHEAAWAAIKARPFVWCSFVWNMFDFGSPVRHEGGLLGINDKGLVTFDHKTRKDAFYFYKANWSDQPVLYITDRRYTERTNAVTDVKIYSNAEDVKLRVNGDSIGTRKRDGESVFLWQDVKLKPGRNLVEASAERDGKKLRDSCVWSFESQEPAQQAER